MLDHEGSGVVFNNAKDAEGVFPELSTLVSSIGRV